MSVDQEQIELNSTSTSSEFSTTSLAEAHFDRKDYFRMYRQRQRKVSHLENIINNLASPREAQSCPQGIAQFEFIAFTNSSSFYEVYNTEPIMFIL